MPYRLGMALRQATGHAPSTRKHSWKDPYAPKGYKHTTLRYLPKKPSFDPHLRSPKYPVFGHFGASTLSVDSDGDWSHLGHSVLGRTTSLEYNPYVALHLSNLLCRGCPKTLDII